MTDPRATSLYDADDYYDSKGSGARLTPCLEVVTGWLDGLRAGRLAAMLPAAASRRSRVLDVGAGTGGMLAALAARGVDVRGTTASRTAAAAAFRRHGLRLLVTTDLPARVRAEGPFDAITYWQVFEHLDEPESHVAAWSDMLATAGFVVVEVPNVDSLGARLCHRSWLGSDPVHHVNPMGRAEIAALLDRHGLEIRRVEGFSLKFTYAFLWSGLLGRLYGRGYDFDTVFDVLKRPLQSLRRRPLRTVNAVVAVAYLAPVIIPLAIWGCVSGRGEVLRMVIARADGLAAASKEMPRPRL